MQTWEYLTLTLSHARTHENEERTWFLDKINGEHIGSLPTHEYEQIEQHAYLYINQRGAEGWELVAMANLEGYNYYRDMVFKRPLGISVTQGAAMHKWEYLEVAGVYHTRVRGVDKQDFIVDEINGQAQDLSTSPLFYAYINQLGEEGWELVSCDGEYRQWVFKRPKP